MLSIFFLLLSILLTVLNPVGHKPVRMPSQTQDILASKARLLKSYGALPMSFEVNQGQADPSVRFLARGQGYTILLKPGETALALEDVSRAKSYEKPAPGGIELGLAVDDVDATWREWQAKGIQTLSAPEDFPFGRAFDAQDPEGHLLSIYKLRAR